MTNQSSTIVQRLWNYCNVLRDDGMSYGDYVEQRLRRLVPYGELMHKAAFDWKWGNERKLHGIWRQDV